jgi:hypothetical protein
MSTRVYLFEIFIPLNIFYLKENTPFVLNVSSLSVLAGTSFMGGVIFFWEHNTHYKATFLINNLQELDAPFSIFF